MKTPDIRLLLVIAAVLTAAVTVVGVNQVFAAPGFFGGASELAPGFFGGAPGDAQNFAPGQEAEQHCIGCVKELTPGQEGLESGIIGPPKKVNPPS